MTSPRVAGIVLAAGASRRLGRAKQLVHVDGIPLVRRVTLAAIEAGCAPLIVVIGARADEVRPALDGLPRIVLHNGDWESGLASSIRKGIGYLASLPDVDGALLLVCDQPELDAQVVGSLLQAFDGAPDSRVACCYAGSLGTPALFGRGWFEQLGALSGDLGARPLLERNPETICSVPWPGGAHDIDRPEDLGR